MGRVMHRMPWTPIAHQIVGRRFSRRAACARGSGRPGSLGNHALDPDPHLGGRMGVRYLGSEGRSASTSDPPAAERPRLVALRQWRSQPLILRPRFSARRLGAYSYSPLGGLLIRPGGRAFPAAARQRLAAGRASSPGWRLGIPGRSSRRRPGYQHHWRSITRQTACRVLRRRPWRRRPHAHPPEPSIYGLGEEEEQPAVSSPCLLRRHASDRDGRFTAAGVGRLRWREPSLSFSVQYHYTRIWTSTRFALNLDSATAAATHAVVRALGYLPDINCTCTFCSWVAAGGRIVRQEGLQ